LILSENSSHHEVFGDIIEYCIACENQRTIKGCVSDNNIEFMLMRYQEANDDYVIELIERGINSILNSYIEENITIHAIGRVSKYLNHYDEEITETNIIWKNKFVGERLPNKFTDTSFGVAYDN
jgi:hypothetical protein